MGMFLRLMVTVVFRLTLRGAIMTAKTSAAVPN